LTSQIFANHPRCATPTKVVMWVGVPDAVKHAKRYGYRPICDYYQSRKSVKEYRPEPSLDSELFFLHPHSEPMGLN